MNKIQQTAQRVGITLTPMQEAVADRMLHSESNLVVLSPTGSGKTYAYLLPLTALLDTELDEVQTVVVVPGRELALQSQQVLERMRTRVRSMAVYGGRSTMEEHRKMREVRPQIIFGTPGRLNDHLDKGNFDRVGVRVLVIDEYDKCLEMGFHAEMSRLVDHLPKVWRKVLLSATRAEEVPPFMRNALGEVPEVIDFLPNNDGVSERVLINKVRSESRDKLPALLQLLCQQGEGKSVVFLNYRDAVARVADFLSQAGFDVSALHGGLDQKAREQAVYRFANGSANVLVSTDLASRGLDIPDINHIIHYHLPETEEAYIHRTGRTARWDKQGATFFLLGPEEELPGYVETDVRDYVLDGAARDVPQATMATVYIGKGKKDKVSKGDIVGFLCKKGGLKSTEIGRIDVMPRYAYAAVAKSKLASVLKMTSGEKIKGIRTVVEEIK